MLALVLAVALAQCTKDTDCKGDRVCTAGECADPAPTLAPDPAAVFEAAERRVRIDTLTRELADLRAEYATSPYGPVGPILGGTVLVVLGSFLTWLFIDQRDVTFFYVAVPSLVGGLALLLGGAVRLSLNLSQRRLLPVQIADREAGLRELGAEP